MTRDIVSRFHSKGVVAAAVLALASRAVAHQTAVQATSDAFDRACVDLIHGKAPKGEQATDALRDACAALMKARGEEHRRVEPQRQEQAQLQSKQPRAQGGQSTAQAGQSAAQVQPGESALAAFALAGNELVGGSPRGATGMRRTGQPFASTLTTNPVGWFTGIGVNAEYLRSFVPQFSWTAGAHYSQANATDTSLYTLGVLGGIDWFIIGQHNEGLRVGPRLDFSFGREAITDDATAGTDTRGRLGLAGEVGYNFIATNGITGGASFGLGGRVAGDKNEELSSGVGGEFGPYVKLGAGYSW
jgi:hypothetical protein